MAAGIVVLAGWNSRTRNLEAISQETLMATVSVRYDFVA
jgi:hypothetical protein